MHASGLPKNYLTISRIHTRSMIYRPSLNCSADTNRYLDAYPNQRWLERVCDANPNLTAHQLLHWLHQHNCFALLLTCITTYSRSHCMKSHYTIKTGHPSGDFAPNPEGTFALACRPCVYWTFSMLQNLPFVAIQSDIESHATNHKNCNASTAKPCRQYVVVTLTEKLGAASAKHTYKVQVHKPYIMLPFKHCSLPLRWIPIMTFMPLCCTSTVSTVHMFQQRLHSMEAWTDTSVSTAPSLHN